MWGSTPSVSQDSARLAARRSRHRRRVLIALGILLLALFGALVWGLRQSPVRIAHIDVYDADTALAVYAREAIRGSYFGIVPRDSIFFFPASRIRAAILAAHSDIAAVSIFRNGFTGISIKPSARVPIARWCGLAPSPDVEEYCYVFDAGGLIYAAATGTQTVNSFTVYAPLADETLEPLLATVAHAQMLPATFDFARQLDTLGSPVTHLVLRGDEVDDYLRSGTRITYVLGREQEAFTALVSASESFNLVDGSVEYVDLRFDGKVYLKKKAIGSGQ